MSKVLPIGFLILVAAGCGKQDQNAVDNSTAPAQTTPTAPVQQPVQPTVVAQTPAVDPKVQQEQDYRAAAEKMLSDWRGGDVPDGLMTTDLADKHDKLLNYVIVGFKRDEFVNDKGDSVFNYKGSVNLKLETLDGTEERQYKMVVTNNAGKWSVYLAH